MRRFIQLSSILIILIFLGGCTSNALYDDVSDISEKNIGILHSNVEKDVVEALFPHASVTEYDKVISLFLDMESNRCDVAVMTQEIADMVVKRNQDYVLLGSVATPDSEEFFVVVPRKDVAVGEDSSIREMSLFEKIKGSLSRNLFNEKAMHLIWGGFKTTVIIFFFGAIVAVILGAFLTYLSILSPQQALSKYLNFKGSPLTSLIK